MSSRRPRLHIEELSSAAQHVLFGLIPIVSTLLLIVYVARRNDVAVDFRTAYFPAAHRLLHGGSPYAVTHADIVSGYAFVYPALSAIAFGPFALISRGAGQVLYMLVCIACVPATLRVLDVRDWRVYGVALLWLPVFVGWEAANLTLPLALLTALAWRYRDRPWVAGLVTAAAISLKPFVWPLGLWLLATRRWRAAGAAVASGLALNLLAWGVVGFGELHTYLRLSGKVTDALWRQGYSMLAVGHRLGLDRGAADAALVIVSVAIAVALVYVAFFRRQERQALQLAVALMLVASPLVWSHYFALLLVPVALARPRLSLAWALPLAMWVCPARVGVEIWQQAVAWAVAGGCLLAVPRPWTPPGRAAAPGGRVLPGEPTPPGGTVLPGEPALPGGPALLEARAQA